MCAINDLAARILIVYESRLPLMRPATLEQRMDAMAKAVEELKLTERQEEDSGAVA